MLSHFGWRAVVAVVAVDVVYFAVFRAEFTRLATRPPVRRRQRRDAERRAARQLLPVPAWVTSSTSCFMAWTVLNAHYPALFLGGFLFFLGFDRATARVSDAAPISRRRCWWDSSSRAS